MDDDASWAPVLHRDEMSS